MNRIGIALLALSVLLVSGVALAQPVKVDLHPIADHIPSIRGDVSIECNTITGTVYTVSLFNLPLNSFNVVLSGNSREDFLVGTVEVQERNGQTVAVFRIQMPCPLGDYETVRVMNGTQLVMFGDLPR